VKKRKRKKGKTGANLPKRGRKKSVAVRMLGALGSFKRGSENANEEGNDLRGRK